MAKKVFIQVNATFGSDGTVRPISFIWIDGETYEIDRIRHIERAAATKVGGTGIRYTVMVKGKERYLFRDEDRWFVEANM